jgi:pimeloyl-ACP methyl ester carboxylesterase
VSEGYADFHGHQTWYRVTGSLDSYKAPLVVVHGGPGCTHDYLDSLTGPAATGRALIHYDQLGNGRSTHLPDRGGGAGLLVPQPASRGRRRSRGRSRRWRRIRPSTSR